MALPWWLRGALTGGAALLKEHLKKKGKELVGKERKKAIAKFAQKQKNGKKEKPKKKDTMSRKELMEHGEREAKREKTKKLRDSTREEFEEAFKKLKPKTTASIKRYKKSVDALKRRKAMGEEDIRLHRIRGGGTSRVEHSITGKVKGDTDLRDFSDSLLKHDKRVAKHVKGLQKLKRLRDYLKKTKTDIKPRGEKGGIIEERKVIKKYELEPKLVRPAKEEFKRIQKKKDRFKKKDGKKKGKQDGAKPKMSQDIMDKIKKHHDIIVPISALGTGGTLKYIKESKKKKSKSKRDRPDLYPPPKKKKE